ncbi:anthranilate synthase component I family protein [Aridibaculum aurantiacum]|uniref:anthranilate synthase component I family protein n=1 Tax=Aridibaculum aurantiacum TaxID=2810307 RepID=UPI001A973556|nr:anthranilate synthase component I family protein [Aridibaculum aurantiacum]
MRPIQVETDCKKMLADVYTPVGIYLRLRDRFPGSVLLESTDFHASENNFSFICIQPIAGIEVTDNKSFEFKYPNEPVIRKKLSGKQAVVNELHQFLQRFQPVSKCEIPVAQGLFGYTTFDAIQFFEEGVAKHFEKDTSDTETAIPLMRYRMYQYVVAINHFKDELYLCENKIAGLESDREAILSLIRSKDVPSYPFEAKGEETSNMTDEAYIEMVKKGISSCHRGDVFQVVLSRRFSQQFTGDEFNVYRALRTVNPSPYLFYFDYIDYRLMGSSPESQLVINKNKAVVHPIAGTFKRTGNDEQDEQLAAKLLEDPKENAEHVMLVDLARNDLSRHASDVKVSSFRKVHYYSHVIHLVSEVQGTVQADSNPFELLASTFPAGTLSGAPKVRAMQIIKELEPTPRGFYGGAIGVIGFDGDVNHAIMIRSFLSKGNTLYSQAGAGVVAASNPTSELQEVNNKLNALKKAVERAGDIEE